MGRKRYVYRGYTRSDLKSRASLPVPSTNITEVDDTIDYIDCVNISLTAAKNVVQEPTFSLAAVCKATNVNRWSAYGPTLRSVNGSKYLVNSLPTNVTGYYLGEYAGYNHNATAPAFINKNSNTEDFFDGPTTNFTFRCRINIGELRYDDISGVQAATHVAFSVWEGSTPIDYAIKPIGGNAHGQDNGKDILDFDTDAGDRLLVSTINYSTTYTLKIWFIDDDVWDYTGDNITCKVTELDEWTHSVYIFSDNHLYINAPGDGSVAGSISGYTSGEWTVNGGSFDYSDGTYIFTTLAVVNYGTYNRATVSFYVETGYYANANPNSWTVIETSTQTSPFYGPGIAPDYGVLVSNDDIGGPWDELAYSGTVPMEHGDYGYRIVIDVDPSTV